MFVEHYISMLFTETGADTILEKYDKYVLNIPNLMLLSQAPSLQPSFSVNFTVRKEFNIFQ